MGRTSWARIAMSDLTDSDLGISASFVQESGATRDEKVVPKEAGAYTHPSRHAIMCAEWSRRRDVAWRSVAWTDRPGVQGREACRAGEDHRQFLGR
jgi:hypothetical protein